MSILESIRYQLTIAFHPAEIARRYGISGGYVEMGEGVSGFVFYPPPLEKNRTPYVAVEVQEGGDPVLQVGRLMGEGVPDVVAVVIMERSDSGLWLSRVVLLVPINPRNPKPGVEELLRMGLVPADIYNQIVYGNEGRFYEI